MGGQVRSIAFLYQMGLILSCLTANQLKQGIHLEVGIQRGWLITNGMYQGQDSAHGIILPRIN